MSEPMNPFAATMPQFPHTPTFGEDVIDFDSDAPLACPLDRKDGEPCESCQ